jgi:hypothetical protein
MQIKRVNTINNSIPVVNLIKKILAIIKPITVRITFILLASSIFFNAINKEPNNK